MAIGSLLTAKEAAELIGVNPSRLSQFVRERRIRPKRRLGHMVLFERSDVQAFAKKKRPTGRPKQNPKNGKSGIAKSK